MQEKIGQPLKQMNKMEFKKEIISTDITFCSLVGFMKQKFPMTYGNYCGVKEGRLVNMWEENLEHLKEKGILGETMEAITFSTGNNKFYVVTDERIPKGYLNKKPCFTGGAGLGSGEAEAISDFMENYLK